jgi:hypothetical protein
MKNQYRQIEPLKEESDDIYNTSKQQSEYAETFFIRKICKYPDIGLAVFYQKIITLNQPTFIPLGPDKRDKD